jgi:hypothetical protein
MDEELELELELERELAMARRRRAELGGESSDSLDLEEVASSAAEGAAVGAAALPALAAAGSAFDTNPTRAPGFRAFSGYKGTPAFRRPTGRGKAGVARTLMEGIGRTVREHPLGTAVAEIGAGAGSGAALSVAEQMRDAGDANDLAVQAAPFIGGVVGGVAPTAMMNMVNRSLLWSAERTAPILGGLPGGKYIPGVERAHNRTAMDRAANRLQSLSADPESAAERVLTGSEGITAPRRTGEEGLMALEARVMADDPAYAAQVRTDLERAITRAETELADLYGTPRGAEEWRRAVFERVSAPGTEIPPGTTDDMLEAAYDSFESMYGPAKGWRVMPRMNTPTRKTTLATMFDNIATTRTTMAGETERNSVTNWLRGKMSSLGRRERDGHVRSEDLLKLRSDIRAQARRVRRSNPDRADLLDLAEDKVTEVLKPQLPPDVVKSLTAADKLYGVFRTVEDAVGKDSARVLTPEKLASSLRSSSPTARTAAARSAGDLGQLSRSGLPVASVLGKPDRARHLVRGMSEEDLSNVHSDFVTTLMNKATRADPETGESVVNGRTLMAMLRQNTPTAKSLRMSGDELSRLEGIGKSLMDAQKKSPAALARTLDDGATSALEAMAVFLGTQSGSRATQMTGTGMSGGIAWPAFFTKRYKAVLGAMNSDKALEFLVQAHKDPDLYAAMLVRETSPERVKSQAAKTLNAWLGYAAYETYDEYEDDIEDLKFKLQNFAPVSSFDELTE